MEYYDTVIHARRRLGHPGDIGAMLFRTIPTTAPILWVKLSSHAVLMRTDVRPDPGRARGVEDYSIDPILMDWPEGTHIRWSIVANASKEVPRPGRRSKRVALTAEDDIRYWAQTRLAFLDPKDIAIGDMSPVLWRGAAIMRRHLSGTGVVRDSRLLGDRLASGVGRGKAMGCGLLRVRTQQSL